MSKREALVLTVEGVGEVRFGKNDLIVALPIGGDATSGWHYISRDAEVFTAPVSDFPPGIMAALAAHGQKQKEKDGTGNAPTAKAAMEIIRRVHGQLSQGLFNATGGGFSIDLILVAALVEYSGKTDAEVREFVKQSTKTERDAMRLDPEIEPIVRRLEQQRTKGVDVKGKLSEFMQK